MSTEKGVIYHIKESKVIDLMILSYSDMVRRRTREAHITL